MQYPFVSLNYRTGNVIVDDDPASCPGVTVDINGHAANYSVPALGAVALHVGAKIT